MGLDLGLPDFRVVVLLKLALLDFCESIDY